MLDAIVPISKDHLKYVYKENVLYDCIDYFEGNFLSRLWVCAKCVFLYYFIGEGKSIIAGAIIGTFFIEVCCKGIVYTLIRRKKKNQIWTLVGGVQLSIRVHFYELDIRRI